MSFFLPLFADDTISNTLDFPVSGTLQVTVPLSSSDLSQSAGVIPNDMQIVEFIDIEKALQEAREQQDLERSRNSWLWQSSQSQNSTKEEKGE